ncbi:Rid family hydrolase [Phenylobacterium sp. LjRoot225]|uniref:Rid family hydrolase n=1 Tax=Phenylobacterium sp. LjRoot225 TaxID=3342285 RepID=UPI003ED0A564
MLRYTPLLAAAILSAAAPAGAAEIVRTSLPGGSIPIAAAVTVPAGTKLVFVSGALPAPGTPGSTEAQSASTLSRIEATLKGLGLSLADVVSARVYLVGDPQKGGEIDFAGLNAAWGRVFGTAEQPNKPSRTTVKVAGLVAPGALVEIEVIAAKPD